MVTAARNNNLEQVKFLVLFEKANVNAKNNSWTALHYAAKNNNLEMVKVLVLGGADVNVAYYYPPRHDMDSWRRGKTALHLAVENGNLEMVKFLKKHGAHETEQ